MNEMKIGVRLHDLGDKSLPDRIALAGKLGFTSAHLASKDLYKSFGIDRSGLVQELAEQLRQNFDQAGIEVAVYGCYKNLAQPVGPKLDEVIKEYAASARFAKWLGADCVGTETGRPNPENKITDERMSKAGLKAFESGLSQALEACEDEDVTLAIEPGFNETVCTPERAHQMIQDMQSPTLKIIYDAVSLLHPTVVSKASEVVQKMLELNGDRIIVLHAKDYQVIDAGDKLGWADGSGKRLVCFGAGECGNFDFASIAAWAKDNVPTIPCIIENSRPDTAEQDKAYLQSL